MSTRVDPSGQESTVLALCFDCNTAGPDVKFYWYEKNFVKPYPGFVKGMPLSYARVFAYKKWDEEFKENEQLEREEYQMILEEMNIVNYNNN